MPSDGNFAFRVLVGSRALPEYTCNGESFVESNLWTPYSYQQEVSEIINGEKECQKFPVTPYKLVLRLGSHCETSAFFVYVDGTLVTKVLMGKGDTKVIEGFQDRGGLKEFLFALPRFARDEKDRIDSNRKSEIGRITIVRKLGRFVKEEYRPVKEVKFSQATKKDAHTVTGGSYTMSTTRKGKYLSRTRPYDVKLKKLWQIDSAVGSLSVNYRMGHSLEEMGVKLQEMDWSVTSQSCTTANRRTLSTTSETSSENSIIESESEVDSNPVSPSDESCTNTTNNTPHHYFLTTNIDTIKKPPLDEIEEYNS